MRQIAVVLAGVLVQACASSDRLVDPPVTATPQEPGVPGVLEVVVRLGGGPPDPQGYLVEVRPGRRDDLLQQRIDSYGGTARFANLPPGLANLRLVTSTPSCFFFDFQPRDVTIVAGTTTRLELTVFCAGQTAIYLRTTSTSFGFVERYLIHEDVGLFRLQMLSRGGLFEYHGTLKRESVAGLTYFFSFRGVDSYSTGTRGEDGCLTIRYSDSMIHSDFENGRFCPSPDTW